MREDYARAQKRCHEKHGDWRFDPARTWHLIRWLLPAVIARRIGRARLEQER